MPELELQTKELLCKFAACTEQEWAFLLKTVDCMVEQILSQHEIVEWGKYQPDYLRSIVSETNDIVLTTYSIWEKKQIFGKIAARLRQGFPHNSTKNGSAKAYYFGIPVFTLYQQGSETYSRPLWNFECSFANIRQLFIKISDMWANCVFSVNPQIITTYLPI